MADDKLPERERILAETVARLRGDLERLREASWTRSVVDVAKGILVGRLGCGVDEAFDYLQDLAASGGRGLIEVSASLLDLPAGIQPATPSPVPGASVAAPRARTASPVLENNAGPGGWVANVQMVLDQLPGAVALLSPIWGDDGELVDLRHDAASPNAIDVAGRGHVDRIGVRILELYPTIAGGPLWRAYQRVLATGVAEMVGPFAYTDVVESVPSVSWYTVRVARLGTSLLVSWIQHDDDRMLAARLDQLQRMGNIGWGVWNRVNGKIEWSDQLYRILDRDPALGPMQAGEYLGHVHPDDVEAVRRTTEGLTERAEPYDIEYRMVVGDGVKHLRAIAEVTRDGAGKPLEIYGFIQDISALRQTRQRLEVIRRELESHQQLLAEEHRLAVQLQRIILPVPDAPLELPGMRVAVRYMPAEQLTRVGGDWFQVNPLPDGALLLAVGDVAGHGLTAAATMAQLRHALAGLAMLSRQPAAILGALNALLCAQPDYDALIATAVVARYEPDDRTLIWAQAGHPPALLARLDRVEQLRRPEGLLLGAARGATYDQATATLEPGDLLLMYTDGLIERPGFSLDDGLSTLTETVTESLRLDGRDPLTSVIRRLRRANPGDDTCILAAQLTA